LRTVTEGLVEDRRRGWKPDGAKTESKPADRVSTCGSAETS
jgi:hypothetical protein